jgi:hypothetical protein
MRLATTREGKCHRPGESAERIELSLKLNFVGLEDGRIDQGPFDYEEVLFEVHTVCRGRGSGFWRGGSVCVYTLSRVLPYSKCRL